MEWVATAIAEQSLARGGLLLHAALAVRDGAGFVLAGPSGIGKSTASRRLPSPWESLSDDCAFVVRDPNGLYWAHPWPTWSLLRDNGPVASWPVEQAVPLKALLFLTQSPFDRTEPVTATPATALIMESAYQLARVVMFAPDGDANRAICAKYLRAAWALAVAVPAFRLRISLAGRFWNEIERAVATEPRMDTDGHGCGHRTEQDSDAREQHAGPRREGTSADDTQCHPDAEERSRLVGRTVGQGPLSPSQKAECRMQNAEMEKEEAGEGRRAATRTRILPEPPRRLLSGSPKPRLVRFRTGRRTFLKLVTGRRVVASVNDIMREWHIRRPLRGRPAPPLPTRKP